MREECKNPQTSSSTDALDKKLVTAKTNLVIIVMMVLKNKVFLFNFILFQSIYIFKAIQPFGVSQLLLMKHLIFNEENILKVEPRLQTEEANYSIND